MPLADLDVESMEVLVGDRLQEQVDKVALEMDHQIEQMRAAGMSDEQIRQTLLDDLNSAGRLFGQLQHGVKNTTKGAIEWAANEGTYREYQEAYGDLAQADQLFEWITVSKEPCPDCLVRHGELQPWSAWQAAGLPGSGFSVCRQHCQCKLVPQGYQGEGLDEPLLRE